MITPFEILALGISMAAFASYVHMYMLVKDMRRRGNKNIMRKLHRIHKAQKVSKRKGKKADINGNC